MKMIHDKLSNKPRGYAFIEYAHTRDMKAAYKQADGKKIDGRRVLVDVERGRTVPNWRPHQLGGGLGTTRVAGEDVKHSTNGNKSVMVTNTKVEIAVRKDVFSSVYGDGGSNLDRLRMISGADVEVQEPSSENDGKVIISGTPDQTQAAQSLLQAFVMAAQ